MKAMMLITNEESYKISQVWYSGVYISTRTKITQRHVAASDTTVSAIHTFFLLMVCFPQVQIKAQAELDRVVNGKFPDFEDVKELPYLTAVVKEVLRSVSSSCRLDEQSVILTNKNFQMGNGSADWQVQATLAFLKLNDNRLLGLPHRTTEDDVYEGYRIPKGSIEIFNSWYE